MRWKALSYVFISGYMLHGTDLCVWQSKVELRHHNIWSSVGPAASSVLSLFRIQHRTTFCSFPGLKGTFFFLLSERETTFPFPKQFISLLDKTPCYIYPTKIADDILPAALLSSSEAYGPVNHTGYNRTGPPEQWNPQLAKESCREIQKDRKHTRKETAEGLRPQVRFHLQVEFCC